MIKDTEYQFDFNRAIWDKRFKGAAKNKNLTLLANYNCYYRPVH